MELLKGYDLSQLTTIRVGGKASLFAQPETFEDLSYLIKLSRDRDIPVYVLGWGSNTIFGDVKGLVISMKNMTGLEIKNSGSKLRIKAMAGTPLRELISVSVKEGVKDFYRLAGFPATVGGAVAMNAGAFGVEVSRFLKSLKIMEWSGKVRELTAEEITFSYRRSPFPNRGLVLECVFEFEKGEENIEEKFKSIREKRKKSQPVDKPTSGSTFKNPYPHHAGELLERVGMKACRIGDLYFSELHSNFLINAGRGTFEDAVKIIEEAKRRVYEEFGIHLEEEVKLIEDSGVDGWKIL